VSLFGVTGTVNLPGTDNTVNNVGIAKEKPSMNVVPEVNATDSIAEEKTPSKTATTTVVTSTTNTTNETIQSVASTTGKEPVSTGEGDNVTKGQTDTDISISAGGAQKQINRWRHSAADCLACVRTQPPSVHELREAFFAGKFLIL
jgi:hypothetical protein